MESIILCFVLYAIDGDTLKLDCDGKRENVRIAQIDAPEKKQPHGLLSTAALNSICSNDYARIMPLKQDKYSRLLANVTCGGKDVANHMLRKGHAWPYMTDNIQLMKQAKIARSLGLGLWGHTEKPIEPSQWRKGVRS